MDAWAIRAEEGRGLTDMGRRAGVERRPCHLRMGQPGSRDGLSPTAEHIGGEEGTGGTETSHVPRGKESIPVVAASELGTA